MSSVMRARNGDIVCSFVIEDGTIPSRRRRSFTSDPQAMPLPPTAKPFRSTHKFIYVGQAGDLSSRPLNHQKRGYFDRHGAKSLLIYVEDIDKTRLSIERDLIDLLKPP